MLIFPTGGLVLGNSQQRSCSQCLGKRPFSGGNLTIFNYFALYHHLSSICIKLTADPAVKLVGSWAACQHHGRSVCLLSQKAPQCSGLVSRQAPWAGERGGVCVRGTAVTADKSCGSRGFFLFVFHSISSNYFPLFIILCLMIQKKLGYSSALVPRRVFFFKEF